MKKIIFLFCLCALSVQAAEGTSGNKNAIKRQESNKTHWDLSEAKMLPQKYADFKKWLNDKFGFSYTLDASFLPQRGAPNGSKTSTQTQYYGTATWNMFN